MTNRMLKTLPAAMALAFAASAAHAGLPIDFGGYFRSGFGTSSGGGKESCFGLAGASAKYRLGNECETYGELAFGGEAYKGQNGLSVRINTMLAFSVNQNQDWEQSSPSWRQINAVAENIGTGYHNLDQAMAGWKNSAGHRKNLLNPDVTEIGIAVAYTPKGKFHDYWALVLARKDQRRQSGPDAGPPVTGSVTFGGAVVGGTD